ncbi:hypothetical protein ACWEQV_20910 [Rhodococcus aetherivorans]
MTDDAERALLVRHAGDGAWESPEMTAYDNEDHLQSIIAAAPQHVSGVPDGAVTVRELPTSAGPADVCIVGPDGDVTIVECKLASNSERRRLVIGQVLDYASAIWRDGPAAFREQWSRQHGADLGALGEGGDAQLDRNLADGRIHLCLAVDQIDADLRRLVEYLNWVTRDEVRVTALQLAYARHGDLEILVPSTYGGEIAAVKARASGQHTTWTKGTFLDALASPSDRELAGRLFALLKAIDEKTGTHDDLWFGNRPYGGIFLHPYGLRYAPMQLWINKAGRLMAYGNWRQYEAVRHHPGFAELAHLVGQDHQSSMKGFAVADVGLDRLWPVVLRCARRINGQETTEEDRHASRGAESRIE